MFNIKRQKHYYTIALGNSHIQLYKTEKGDFLGKKAFSEVTSVFAVDAASAVPDMEMTR